MEKAQVIQAPTKEMKRLAEKTMQKKRGERPLSSVMHSANDPDKPRPIVRLPSGAERQAAFVSIIPNSDLLKLTTVGDWADGIDPDTGKPKSRTLVVPSNTTVIGFEGERKK